MEPSSIGFNIMYYYSLLVHISLIVLFFFPHFGPTFSKIKVQNKSLQQAVSELGVLNFFHHWNWFSIKV